MQEAASSLRAAFNDPEFEIAFRQAQQLGAAKAWAGAATSFYGRWPTDPCTLLCAGMPHAPRRRSPNPELRGYAATQKVRIVNRDPQPNQTTVSIKDIAELK